MLTFLDKYGASGKFTQNNEWGVLQECIKRIKPKAKTAVEFGAPSFEYCSNCAELLDHGWSVIMFDINKNADTRIKQAMITPDNVNQIVGKPTVLSIDIDCDDLHVWIAYEGKSDIVIIEVNSSVIPPQEQIPGDRGASYTSMLKLGLDKGYFLVCHTGNMIFCLNKYRELFPEVVGDGLSNWSEYFNRSHL